MVWELDGDPIGPNSLLSAINDVVVSKRRQDKGGAAAELLQINMLSIMYFSG